MRSSLHAIGLGCSTRILHKLLGVTTDNAANNNTLLACLERVCHDRGIVFDKSEQHVRCVAHVVNLAVQALLRELGTDASDGESSPNSGDSDAVMQAGKLPCIAQLRRLVVKVRTSPQRRSDFKCQCRACGVPEKQLICDVRTRWNSTHAMIKRACELRVPLPNLAKTNFGFPALSLH
jgi:hypothetical protein